MKSLLWSTAALPFRIVAVAFGFLLVISAVISLALLVVCLGFQAVAEAIEEER